MATTVVTVNQPHDIYIGRPSKWGNPFVIGRDGNREEVIEKFKHWFAKRLEQDSKLWDQIGELVGKRLACFCAPRACHGDVLAAYADAYERFMHL